VKVKELIEALKDYPEDMMVVLRGYEGGYSEITDSCEIMLALVDNADRWYFGEHEKANEYTKNAVQAVLVS
jgi:hypothetical protein